ncbi:hypothetical protein NDU88_011800 [Pleurodeles waltl]|uniref:Uncharacterized protein n=1 Tax=Pleurodeles waltl TaxID=8319 RepID=A0AAV7QYD5_PLEWA|nr:hypothetical protein NDU88_011800 [Pleurodeles waltl]
MPWQIETAGTTRPSAGGNLAMQAVGPWSLCGGRSAALVAVRPPPQPFRSQDSQGHNQGLSSLSWKKYPA